MLAWILANPVQAVALALTLVAGVLGGVTVLLSVLRGRRDRRRARTREQVREDLLDRLFEPDPDWDQWVQQLSTSERRELRWVIDAYLRRFRGTERESLCALAAALDIPSDARADLAEGRDRFASLTWLTALKEPVEFAVLEGHCTETPRLRAAAARLLHEAGDEVEAADRRATELLVGDGEQPLSVFGLDTLYRLNRGVATPLLSIAAADADTWGLRFRIQALTVLRFCQAEAPDEHFEWILPLLGHESPRLRTAASLALEGHGWRSALRPQIDLDGRFRDPELTVRQAIYYALAAWGDESSAKWLEWGLFTEGTERGRLTVVRALTAHRRVESLPTAETIAPYRAWVHAERQAGRHYRRAPEGLLWS